MRDTSNLHQKVQEMCDCFATNDPLKEMSRLHGDSNHEEAAIKWLALAILHGINTNAEEISLEQTQKGAVKVVAEYRRAELPPPGPETGHNILQSLKRIIHVDSSQGDSTLAFGVRNSNLDLQVKTREEGGDSKITIRFP